MAATKTATEKWLFGETDEEPDDILAIAVLLKRGYWLKTIVVGEGKDIKLKIRRMLMNLALLMGDSCAGAGDFALIGGTPSDKPFHKEGEEFAGLPDVQLVPVTRDDQPSGYVDAVKAFVGLGGRRFFSIKPPREMMAHLDELRGVGELRLCTLFAYGSFNIRQVTCRDSDENAFDPQKQDAYLKRLLPLFGRVEILESYPAFGDDNLTSCKNLPASWQVISNPPPEKADFFRCFTRLVASWDDHIFEKSRDDALLVLKDKPQLHLDELPMAASAEFVARVVAAVPEFGDAKAKSGLSSAGMRLKRKVKVYQAYRDQQARLTGVVAADFIMACAFENPEFARFLARGRPGFDRDGNLTMAPDDASSVWRYEKMGSPGIFDAALARFLSS